MLDEESAEHAALRMLHARHRQAIEQRSRINMKKPLAGRSRGKLNHSLSLLHGLGRIRLENMRNL